MASPAPLSFGAAAARRAARCPRRAGRPPPPPAPKRGRPPARSLPRPARSAGGRRGAEKRRRQSGRPGAEPAPASAIGAPGPDRLAKRRAARRRAGRRGPSPPKTGPALNPVRRSGREAPRVRRSSASRAAPRWSAGLLRSNQAIARRAAARRRGCGRLSRDRRPAGADARRRGGPRHPLAGRAGARRRRRLSRRRLAPGADPGRRRPHQIVEAIQRGAGEEGGFGGRSDRPARRRPGGTVGGKAANATGSANRIMARRIRARCALRHRRAAFPHRPSCDLHVR
jgi:hypothetical protein